MTDEIEKPKKEGASLAINAALDAAISAVDSHNEGELDGWELALIVRKIEAIRDYV